MWITLSSSRGSQLQVGSHLFPFPLSGILYFPKWPLFTTWRWCALFPAGWSRYDHFASLCELLPVALPSLILRWSPIIQGLLHTDWFTSSEDWQLSMIDWRKGELHIKTLGLTATFSFHVLYFSYMDRIYKHIVQLVQILLEVFKIKDYFGRVTSKKSNVCPERARLYNK